MEFVESVQCDNVKFVNVLPPVRDYVTCHLFDIPYLVKGSLFPVIQFRMLQSFSSLFLLAHLKYLPVMWDFVLELAM